MKDKVVLITGASMGMGKAATIKFAQAGAAVVVADINEAAANALANELTAQGYKAIAIGCDVSNAVQVKAMINKTVETYGRLDAAFNNAGIQNPSTDIADYEEEEYDRILNINLKGVWLCMKYELQQMRKQGSGAIVNNSSLAGLVGAPGRAPYAAAKHGIIGLTKSAAAEYASKGIRVNAVCPGTINTPMVDQMISTGDLSKEMSEQLAPIGRLGEAEEVAETVFWLCSSGASYVVGQAISVDGGYTIL